MDFLGGLLCFCSDSRRNILEGLWLSFSTWHSLKEKDLESGGLCSVNAAGTNSYSLIFIAPNYTDSTPQYQTYFSFPRMQTLHGLSHH